MRDAEDIESILEEVGIDSDVEGTELTRIFGTVNAQFSP